MSPTGPGGRLPSPGQLPGGPGRIGPTGHHVVAGGGRAGAVLWVVRAWDGELHDPQPDEHDELRWVGVADLPRMCLAHPAYVEVLRRAVELRSTAFSGE